MRGNLFKKLFFTYGITIVISFAILALSLFQLFKAYSIESKKEILVEQGEKITKEIALSFYTGRFNNQRILEELQILDEFLNARIWITDEGGVIIGVSGSEPERYLGQKIEGRKLFNMLQGDTIVEEGNFEGKLRETSITVGYPIFFKNEFRGAVLVHASLPEVQETFKDIYRLTLIAIAFAMGFAYFVLYFQIRKITEPLLQISEAAKIISNGEFQKRLNIKTSDEIEELSKSFNQMAESLENIEDNRRNLIMNISHDLRSPMTSIRGFIEGVIDGTIPKEKHEYYLNIVLDECKRLIKITNDILELNNMQQGIVKINKTEFELNEFIRRKLISYEQQITKKNLKIDLYLDSKHTFVFSDITFCDRIFSNLLDNAIKFTPDGENIKIQVEQKDENIVIAIINTGVTLSEAEQKKIWDRFYKSDVSRGEYRMGFGLGLSIVWQMITKLEENIWVESGEDCVKFYFTLKKA